MTLRISNLPKNVRLHLMVSMSETGEPAGPQWIHGPTEEPLSPELRAAVVEDLKETWYFGETENYRRSLKASWVDESVHQTIKDPNVSPEPRQLDRLCNNLTAFYWMPSPQVDGRPLPITPFGCIYKEWFRYHNGRLPIEFGDFIAHLVRVYPTGSTTIQEVITAHKKRPGGRAWPDPRACNLNATYQGIIIMMDQYLEPAFEPDLGELIDLHEEAQKLTVLLVRTGDDSNLCAPINFEKLRIDGFCLPLARSDVLATSDDVVRVSLATAVKFVSDLHQREVDAHPPIEALRDWEQRAQRYADQKMEKADADGIDNVRQTWSAVRRVKAARKREIFDPREPYPFSRHWK